MPSRIGIIGAGSISEYHIRAIGKTPGMEVSAITDINAERAHEVAERYGIPRVHKDADALLASRELDAVTIGVWNAAHASLSIKALEAGKHVFCEKPMARNAAEAAAMAKTADETGNLLMVGLVRRFDEKTDAARAIVASGVLGDVYFIKTGYLRRDGQPGGWFSHKESSGGGALIDIGIHSLDLALYLADAGPVVSARGQTWKLPDIMAGLKGTQKYLSKDQTSVRDVEDMVQATLFLEGGATLSLEASWAQHIPADTQYLEIYGTKAGLIVDPNLRLISNRFEYAADTGFNLQPGDDWLEDIFHREMNHFRDCLAGKEKCRSSSAEGLELMRVIDAIYRSAEEGREINLERG